MQAEIVTIGTELLLGEIVDTNSAWIAQKLTTIGLDLFYTTTVGDNLERIVDVLQSSLQRSDVVITTGGLGPTVDDITRDAAAAATGREVVYDEELFQEVARYFAKRHYSMTDNNRKQACLPAGAQIIHNPVGTAPAFLVERDGHVLICLPGVPHEMRYLMENEILPYLRQHFDLHGIIKSRTLHTCGIGESAVDFRIGDLMELSNPTVGTRAHPGQTDVCITAKADSEREADALIAGVETALRERLGDYIFGADEQAIGDVVAEALTAKGLRLAVVETSTWGELAQRLGNASEGDRALAGSLVLPNMESLIKLGISSDLVKQHGFPSQEVADAAAEQVRQVYDAAYGLAIIGPADPGAENAPPVYFSLAIKGQIVHGQPRQGRSGVVGRGWLTHLGMDLVRRHLLRLSKR